MYSGDLSIYGLLYALIQSLHMHAVGLFGIGLDTYWGQFSGLLDRLKTYQNTIAQKLGDISGLDVIDAGMVDNPDKASGI